MQAPVLKPRQLWGTIMEHGLFGQYNDDSMEDAATLFRDMAGGCDDGLINTIFGVHYRETIICDTCTERISNYTRFLVRLLPPLPVF